MKALVKQSIAPINVKAAFEATLSDEVMSGMTVEILSNTGSVWYEIKTSYNYTGFIHSDCLLMDENKAAEWEAAEKYLVDHSSADILSEPKVQGYLLDNLTKGCLIRIINMDIEQDGWAEVESVRGRGFIRKKFIKPQLPAYDFTDEDGFRERLVKEAESYLGTQYRWGGKTPVGIDCSGLCAMAYMINGVNIYRDAAIIDGFPVKRIDFSDIKKGDLIFFPGHVAMYTGNGRYIHSSARNDGVYYNSLNREDEDYWESLVNSITECGSIFVR